MAECRHSAKGLGPICEDLREVEEQIKRDLMRREES